MLLSRFFQRVKPVLVVIFWIVCSVGVITLLGASLFIQHDLVFQDITVNVDTDNGMLFIDQDEVMQLMRDQTVNADRAKPIGSLDYQKLETVIEKNPFVESAEIFVDANEKIAVSVRQRFPILRIINNQSVSYYLDDQGRRMPLSSNFTARVPVATGFILTNAEHQTSADSVTEQKLFTLASFIRSDSFLASLTEQIIINQQNEFEIVPKVGNHLILLGDEKDLQAKFDKLKIFYREGLKYTGWDQYSIINLKYKNEVYCTKRSASVWKAESIKAN